MEYNKMIQEMRSGDQIEGIYVLKMAQSRTTNNGKPFLAAVITDCSGSLEAKVWDYAGPVGPADEGTPVKVRGTVSEFRGALQLTVDRIRRLEEADQVEAQFSALFLAGGMVLSQVANLTGLEPYTVQNWVKRGFLPPPEQKRYTLRQLCRIININMLRASLPLEKICGLLSYVNGRLDDTADDIIDDARLYFLFVRLAARAKQLDAPELWDQAMEAALADYEEPVPGARERVRIVLRIMLTAWLASRMMQETEKMLSALQ